MAATKGAHVGFLNSHAYLRKLVPQITGGRNAENTSTLLPKVVSALDETAQNLVKVYKEKASQIDAATAALFLPNVIRTDTYPVVAAQLASFDTQHAHALTIK